jgi:hypothetical protein
MSTPSVRGKVSRRYERQIKLPEIGHEGQATLCESSASIGGRDFAGEIEARYVAGAGVRIVPAERSTAVDLAPLGLRHSSPIEVGEGALRALLTLRRVLRMDA